jgi:protein-L-isoaspartate(D-aspartate) O-methyltransferase
MIDYAIARLNMVESQVRANGITDNRIIEAMLRLPREQFVPAGRSEVAYMDEDIPLTNAASGGAPRMLMEPMAFARLVQLARIHPGDTVLHIGAGSGYGTSILSQLGKTVVAVEENTALAETARQNLASCHNVSLVTGPLASGHRAAAPYDVILVEGRIEEIPESLMGQLKDGGRLVSVVGNGIVAKGICITKTGESFSERRGFDATVPELPGFEAKKPEFVF